MPVPDDADSPKFRVRRYARAQSLTSQASVGTVHYLPEKSAFVWRIKQLGGGREYLMRAHFGLPSVKGDEARRRAERRGRWWCTSRESRDGGSNRRDRSGLLRLLICPQGVIVAVLRDVADPWQSLVAAALDDLEVSNLDAGDGEVAAGSASPP